MSYSSTILADNPQAYYRLDETAGTVATDSSGNGYTATLSGVTLSQPGALTGDTDTSMLFTAAGKLTLPSRLNPATFSALTLDFWINLDMQWHYVAVTTSNATGQTLLYLDGIATTSGSGASVFISALLDASGSLTVAGTLDEVALYSTALSSARILAHYLVGMGLVGGGSYVAMVAGVPQYVIASTLNVTSSIGRRSQANFMLRTSAGSHFQQYQQVSVYDKNGVLVFSGYIVNPKEQRPGPFSLLHTIQCTDQHFLADKRVVAAIYTNATPGFIVNDLLSTILAAEGVTVGLIYDGTAVGNLFPNTTLYPSLTLYPAENVGVIPNATFVYCTVAAALDELVKVASAAGVPYYWQIDQNKQLWFVPYTSVINSTLVDGLQIDDGHASGTAPTVTRANPTYRNTQYVLGGVAQTASQTETRKGDSNITAWTMDYDLATVPTITVNASAKTVGIKGVSTGKDFYWQKGSPVITQDSGGTKLTTSDTLQVIYTGQYPSVYVDQNSAQIAYELGLDGSTGIIEAVEADSTLSSAAEGLSEASTLLTRYSVQGLILQFSTLTPGFDQGQLITVNLPMHGIYNQQLLIESVQASDQTDGYNIWYQVNAVLGPYDTTWVQFFSRMLSQRAPADSINIGVSQSLVIAVSGTISLSPTVTGSAVVYSCPLPSTTLYPSLTLYCC